MRASYIYFSNVE
jgi:hypothetical protein